MQEKNDRINNLLTQYLNKTISKVDFEELFNYISKDENKQILDNFMETADKANFPNAEAHQVDWEHMYNNIVADKKEPSKYTLIIKVGKRLAIAATVLIVGYLGFRFIENQPYNHPTAIFAKQDLLPGSNKATLKLADGTEITLNNAHAGVFAKQGTSNISKSNDGLIAYNETSADGEKRVYINTLSTQRGGQYKLMLPDKSLVWLNAESSITYPSAFVGKQRKVSITGEVYFEVSKDRSRPFIVGSGFANVEVLGTHFNINVYPNEEHSAVTLLEGSIKLSTVKDSKVLIPGQQAVFGGESNNIQLRNVDTDNVVDWKNGLFVFEDASVVEVMRQIEKWYDVDVRYIGKIPSIKFNGVVSRKNNVSKLLKLLQAAGNIEFNINNKIIEVKQTNQ